MSLLGPEVTSSPLFAKIQASYVGKNFEEAEELIKAADNPDDAQAIYDLVFKTVHSNCWLAFLKNPHLNHVLWYNPLNNIVRRLEAGLKLRDKTLTLNMNRILLLIVHNDEWCRTLSYRYFIDFVPLSKPLAAYMVTKPEFLIHLHYTHFSLLINKLPDLTNKLLETLDDMILNEEEHTERVIAILKWLLINDAVARNMILSSPKLSNILDQLFFDFEDDRIFVLEVLKQPELCHQWLESDDAYQHPLLRLKDYHELAKHYMLRNTPLSKQYITLAGSLLEQELSAVIDELEAMKIEDAQESFLSYTPAIDLAISANQQQPTTLLKNDKPKNKL